MQPTDEGLRKVKFQCLLSVGPSMTPDVSTDYCTTRGLDRRGGYYDRMASRRFPDGPTTPFAPLSGLAVGSAVFRVGGGHSVREFSGPNASKRRHFSFLLIVPDQSR